jgi:membrane associated rhomboid family serine protease
MLIVPVANTAQIRRRPWITYILVALNTAVWLYGAVAPAPKAPIDRYYALLDELQRKHGLPFESPQVFELRLARGLILDRSHPDFQRWREQRRVAEAALAGTDAYMVQELGFVPERGFDHRLVTAMFLHGDFMHLFMNMLFLFLFGCNVEDAWGRWRYALFYFAAGVAANLVHYVSDPRGDLPLVGASGAVSGVMGAFVVFFAWTRIKFFWWFLLFGFFEVPAIVAIAAWFLLQVLNATVFHLDSVVAYWAHVGGFLFGLAVAIVVRLIRGPYQVVEKRPGPPPRQTAVALPGALLLDRNFVYQESLRRAEAHLAAGEHDEAVALFAKVLDADPRNTSARWGLVRSYQAQGRRREALHIGEELITDLAVAGRADEARRVYSFLMS